MNLQNRVDLLAGLGQYILSDNPSWQEAKEKAALENNWFTPEFIEIATKNIAKAFLQKDKLEAFASNIQPSFANLSAIVSTKAEASEGKHPTSNIQPKTVGIVMAGNIPLVGFHDWLCVFLSGHRALVKPSSQDQSLIKHLVEKLAEENKEAKEMTGFAEMLKGCDAYIATGSNNSSRYFEYYFGKYPHIIRRNRTSVAILEGNETTPELEKLADDVYLYFGRGCRNVTKIYVPEGYDFVPLLEAFRKYNHLADHHKYKNNLDYNLAIYILNKRFYMSNGSLLLLEEPSVFSPIGQLNYEFYTDRNLLERSLSGNEDLQCIVSKKSLPFGAAQSPKIDNYADGVDTMAFLTKL